MKNYKLYSYRYMWTLKGVQGKCNFKIVTETLEGLQAFEQSVKENVSDLENFGREYICEYDCSKLGIFDDIKNI